MATKRTTALKSPKDYPKSSYEWMEREDDYLLEASLNEGSKVTVSSMSVKLKRDPLYILNRLLSGDVADMVGFEADVGSDEECEFVGLCLAGVSVREALMWCVVSDDRPSQDDLIANMTCADLREPLRVAAACGVWIRSAKHLKDLEVLVGYPMTKISQAVANVSASFDVPTVPVVLAALMGKLVLKVGVIPIVRTSTSCSAKAPWAGYKKSTSKRRTPSSTGTKYRSKRYKTKRFA